jgi:hypothetical protein
MSPDFPYEGVVPQGYLPPDSAFLPAQPALRPDPNDPLINAPYAGINGWFQRLFGLFKRSWRSMTTIFTLTHLLPLIAFGVAGLVGVATLGKGLVIDASTGQLKFDSAAFDPAVVVPLFLVVVFVGLIGFVIMQMIGYAAATYAVTREAAGMPTRLGEALKYGLRRSLGLFGWQVVVALLTIAGFLACILPGIYVIAATALFGPIYLFERDSPIGRTFSIFNNNLGRVLGRLAMTAVMLFGASMVINLFEMVGNAVAGTTADPLAVTGAAVVIAVISSVLQLPVTMLQFGAILVTYTEQRGHEAPVITADLANELG